MNGNQTSSRLRHAIILAIGLGVSNFAFSLRLGPINVKSYLGQPINATIRVDGLSSGAASSTKVSLASPAAYRSHGIEMLPIHSQMRFSLVPSGKGYIIHVSSTGGVKEPFVNFLVTVSGNGSTVTREYAAFFNPNPVNTIAGKSNTPTAVIEKGTPSKQSNVIVERSEPPKIRSHAANTSGWGGKPVAKKPAFKPSPQPVRPVETPTSAPVSSGSPNTPSSIPVGSSYGPIKPGETLYSIAKAARPSESMRIYDMMRLIYKANRRAFIGNDMGNLMAGATLYIPDPAHRQTKPAPEKKSSSKPAAKPERKTPPPVNQPSPVEEKRVIPENIPTSPTAQLALGVNEDKKEEDRAKTLEVNLPATPVEEKKETPETKSPDQTLTLDSPETIDIKSNIEVPPPVVELPKPTPVEEIKPEPKPIPKPAPQPSPRPTPPAPKPAPTPAADDSFFGLGNIFSNLGIPLPILGGAFAGLLALLGGLFWFLKKRKNTKEDEVEELTEEEINQLVAEMENEHGGVDFDQVTATQSSYDENIEQPMVTKLDPISEPFPEEQGSVDELSDDFFKDLEVSVEEGETTNKMDFLADQTITDNTAIDDDFFEDLDFGQEAENAEKTEKVTNDDFDFLHDSSTNSDETFLAEFDDSVFTEIDHSEKDEPKTPPADDFDDFFSTKSSDSEEDFFADDALDELNATRATEDNLDFLEDLDPDDHEDNLSFSTSEDDGLDFFVENDQEKKEQKAEEVIDFSTDDNSLDFFDTADELNKIPENDFFAEEDSSKTIELEKKEDTNADFFSDPVSEVVPPAAEVPAKPAAPLLAKKPTAPKLATTSAPKVDEEAMEINLDMAKSFISMGKSEKARSWLEEVLDLGTDAQKAEAQKMLSKIDKG